MAYESIVVLCCLSHAYCNRCMHGDARLVGTKLSRLVTDVCGHGCVTSRGQGTDMDQPLGTEAIHQADRRGRSQSRLKRSILHLRKSLCERSSDLCRNINTKTRSRTYNQRDASPSCTIARELCAGAQLSWLGWARGGLPEGADTTTHW